MSDFQLWANRASGSVGQRVGAAAFGAWRARWVLARWWMSRFALSYLTSAIFVLLIVGFLIGFSLDEVVRGEDVPNLLADGFFLMLLSNLALNWTSTGYIFVGDDSFFKKVSFLRALPTSAGDVVSMRLLVLLTTLLVMTPLNFLPPYLIFDSVREAFGPYRYLCFVLLWASYGLICGCASAYLELGFRARTMFLTQAVWSGLLLVFVLLVSTLGGGIVEGSVGLAFSHGPLVAGTALLAAAGVTYLWYRLAERRLRGRELGA